MKRPSFQFYPADWRNNAKLRRCSEAARGIWMDILCVLHDSDEYGVCRWPLADLARSANAPIRLVKELAAKEVLKGSDKNPEPYIYTPRHAGKAGEPVVLVQANGGPCWYSSRFVRDEWVRIRRGNATQFTSENQPPKHQPDAAPKASPKGGIGERQGDGPTSSSTSTYISKEVTHSNSGELARVSENKNPGTEAGRVCKAIKAAGISSVSPSHPELVALIDKGVTVEMFAQAAETAVGKGKGFAYLLGVIKGQLSEASEIAAGPGVPQVAWDTNRQTIEAMGVKLGLGKWSEFATDGYELFAAYTARVRLAVEGVSA